MGKRLAISVADPVVARLMTVRALLDLLGKGDAGEKAKLPMERAPFTSTSFESLWRIWLNSRDKLLCLFAAKEVSFRAV
jgi:hypothetical protein